MRHPRLMVLGLGLLALDIVFALFFVTLHRGWWSPDHYYSDSGWTCPTNWTLDEYWSDGKYVITCDHHHHHDQWSGDQTRRARTHHGG